jgi:hypothetical protein
VRSLRSAVRGALLCATLAVGAAAAKDVPPTPQQVQQAAEAVRIEIVPGDGKRIERRLRWKNDAEKKPEADAAPAPWLIGLVRWLSMSGRWLMALLGIAAAIALIVFARRWLRVHAELGRVALPPLPSHVRELDIRPESLPGDIAGAARALWLAGEERAALSLLYRGALSRLVHDHSLPIRSASTEGECVALAQRLLPPGAAAFFKQLVGAWLTAVYGARSPTSPQVLGLCDGFDLHLSPRGDAQAAR